MRHAAPGRSDVVPARWAPTSTNDGSCRGPAVAEPTRTETTRPSGLDGVGCGGADAHDRPLDRCGVLVLGGALQQRERPGGTSLQRGGRAVRQRLDVARGDLEQVEAEGELVQGRVDARSACQRAREPTAGTSPPGGAPPARPGGRPGRRSGGRRSRPGPRGRSAPSPRPAGPRRPCPCSSGPSRRASRPARRRRRRRAARWRRRRPAAAAPQGSSGQPRGPVAQPGPEAARRPGSRCVVPSQADHLAHRGEARGRGHRRPAGRSAAAEITSTSRPVHRPWWSSRGTRKDGGVEVADQRQRVGLAADERGRQVVVPDLGVAEEPPVEVEDLEHGLLVDPAGPEQDADAHVGARSTRRGGVSIESAAEVRSRHAQHRPPGQGERAGADRALQQRSHRAGERGPRRCRAAAACSTSRARRRGPASAGRRSLGKR